MGNRFRARISAPWGVKVALFHARDDAMDTAGRAKPKSINSEIDFTLFVFTINFQLISHHALKRMPPFTWCWFLSSFCCGTIRSIKRDICLTKHDFGTDEDGSHAAFKSQIVEGGARSRSDRAEFPNMAEFFVPIHRKHCNLHNYPNEERGRHNQKGSR